MVNRETIHKPVSRKAWLSGVYTESVKPGISQGGVPHHLSLCLAYLTPQPCRGLLPLGCQLPSVSQLLLVLSTVLSWAHNTGHAYVPFHRTAGEVLLPFRECGLSLASVEPTQEATDPLLLERADDQTTMARSGKSRRLSTGAC